jgi:hypothetical protein
MTFGRCVAGARDDDLLLGEATRQGAPAASTMSIVIIQWGPVKKLGLARSWPEPPRRVEGRGSPSASQVGDYRMPVSKT